VTAAFLAAAVMFAAVGTALSTLAYLPAQAVAETISPARPAARAWVWFVALMVPVAGAAGGAAWAVHAWFADPYGDPHLTSGHPHLCAQFLLSSPDAPWLTVLVAWAAVGLVVAALTRAALGWARSARLTSRFRRRSPLSGPAAVVDDEAPLVVTIGIFRPLIVVSSGTVRLLAPAQLRAVLHHEAAHVARRDNLYEMLATAAATCLALAPTAYLFLRYWREEAEHACDDRAAAETSPEHVAQALRTLVATVTAHSAVTPAASATRWHLTRVDRRARRLTELAQPTAQPRSYVRPLEIGIAALAAAGLLTLVTVATAGQIGDSLRCLADALLRAMGGSGG
jgi:Zn-dependent protease with chaperone function